MWSITYHSWLTFVLLLWACLVWTVRSRHQLAMLCAPCVLLYGLTLCCLRYVWALDLRAELPTALGPISLRQLGLEHTRYPCLDLGAMVRAGTTSHLHWLCPMCVCPVPQAASSSTPFAAAVHAHLLAAAAPVCPGEAARQEAGPGCAD